jgi:hypothetical protein
MLPKVTPDPPETYLTEFVLIIVTVTGLTEAPHRGTALGSGDIAQPRWKQVVRFAPWRFTPKGVNLR